MGPARYVSLALHYAVYVAPSSDGAGRSQVAADLHPTFLGGANYANCIQYKRRDKVHYELELCGQRFGCYRARWHSCLESTGRFYPCNFYVAYLAHTEVGGNRSQIALDAPVGTDLTYIAPNTSFASFEHVSSSHDNFRHVVFP